ncbi:MAG: xanthine dehydrogenase family protein molybdopterin-binding subunit [Nitrospinota bacterium]
MAADRVSSLIGKSPTRADAIEKATGATRFSDDVSLPGMLWGRALRSPVANARIGKLDVRGARDLPGVHAVLTAADIPGAKLRGNLLGARDDQPVLAEGYVRAVGDPVALVAAESWEIAEEALSRIRVEYETLPLIEDPLKAAESTAPQVDERGNVVAHYGFRRGDVETGFAGAAAIVEETYDTQCVEHAYLETEAGLAWLDPGDVVHIRCGTQMIENFRFVARILGLPHNQVRIESPELGGGFGGKIMLTIEPFLALLVKATGRPVRMSLTREESILSSTKRHPYVMRYKVGADADGRLTALVADIVGDAGAYTDLSAVICKYSMVQASGPYRCPNVQVDMRMVLTHNPTATAMRGVGSPQITFALEGLMDTLAERLGMDPFELRKRNYLSKGEALTTGQPLKHAVRIAETLEEARRALEEADCPNGGFPEEKGNSERRLRASGFASNMTGYGRHGAVAEAYVGVQLDGSAVVAAGAPDLGAGQGAGFRQLTASLLGLPMDRVTVLLSDSQTTPLVGMTAGSRQFLNTGSAIERAAEPIVRALKDSAANLLEARAEDVVLAEGRAFVRGAPDQSVSHAQLVAACTASGASLTSLGAFKIGPEPYPGSDTAHEAGWVDYTFGGAAAEVSVDPQTGEVTLHGLGVSHDVGTAVNPQTVTGQFEGGTSYGMGLALFEDCCVKEGKPDAHDFAEYILSTPMDAPAIGTAIVESGEGAGPFGARGIGEAANNTSAAAIANAVSRAIGIRVTSLPITPEKVLLALQTGSWPS